MRSAGTIRDKAHARRFADFLLTRGISARLDHREEGYTVWVHDEDRLAEVRSELPRFLAAPEDPRYNLSRAAESLRAQARQAEPPPRPTPVVAVAPTTDAAGLMGTPLALAIIAFSLVVAVYTQFDPPYAPRLEKLTIDTITTVDAVTVGWNGLDEVRGGEVWRLITPCFVHYGYLHIIMNMLGVFIFGRTIEASRGTLTLAFLVLVIGALSNYAQYIVAGPQFGGMSGVVYGLFGYVLVMARFAPSTGIKIDPIVALTAGAWFLLCFTGLVGSVANWAHGVGMVLGVAFGGIGVWLHERRR